ncbi:hypothetical protein GCM10010329_16820 [Streptomyces spiroverticillatus]|uniref:Uncharacterized protein n=1 Tax=Streptomyces finlayi TaxID=67296 RepID=A0A918WTQ1_9ACTN|nr:hypothetical protein GCM10010329_16820 [Streptomyces spiroverticillatus]GHC81735.1 hypothetical protein GCM10010334_09300 [Streptomyces finlayi]
MPWSAYQKEMPPLVVRGVGVLLMVAFVLFGFGAGRRWCRDASGRGWGAQWASGGALGGRGSTVCRGGGGGGGGPGVVVEAGPGAAVGVGRAW